MTLFISLPNLSNCFDANLSFSFWCCHCCRLYFVIYAETEWKNSAFYDELNAKIASVATLRNSATFISFHSLKFFIVIFFYRNMIGIDETTYINQKNLKCPRYSGHWDPLYTCFSCLDVTSTSILSIFHPVVLPVISASVSVRPP